VVSDYEFKGKFSGRQPLGIEGHIAGNSTFAKIPFIAKFLISVPGAKDIAGFVWVRGLGYFCVEVAGLNSVVQSIIVNKCNDIILSIEIRIGEHKSKNTFQVLVYMQYVPAFNTLSFIILDQGCQHIVIA